MKVEIITIGDEIISGDILNTNVQYLAQQCWDLGLQVEYHTTVRDLEGEMREAFDRAAKRAQIVICTGGLGPTADDFTIEAAAQFFKKPLVCDDGTLQHLIRMYEDKGRELKDNNKKQAFVPQGGQALFNSIGTAPGVFYEHHGVAFYFLQGVPREMKTLFQDSVLPDLVNRQGVKRIFQKKFIRLFGISESDVDHKLQDLFSDRTHIGQARIGFRAQFPEIMLKVSVWNESQSSSQAILDEVVSAIQDRLAPYIFSYDPQIKMEALLVQALKKNELTMAVAESCTGGLIAHRMTNVSGASEVFLGGVVSYANALKQDLLTVPESIIAQNGAVSEECARAMVEGLKKSTGADLCAAVTGIAGPTGGSVEKPVGTVHVAFYLNDRIEHQHHVFSFSREGFKQMVSSVVLKRLLDHLQHGH